MHACKHTAQNDQRGDPCRGHNVMSIGPAGQHNTHNTHTHTHTHPANLSWRHGLEQILDPGSVRIIRTSNWYFNVELEGVVYRLSAHWVERGCPPSGGWLGSVRSAGEHNAHTQRTHSFSQCQYFSTIHCRHITQEPCLMEAHGDVICCPIGY